MSIVFVSLLGLSLGAVYGLTRHVIKIGAQVKWLSQQENDYRFKLNSLRNQLVALKNEHQKTRQQLKKEKCCGRTKTN